MLSEDILDRRRKGCVYNLRVANMCVCAGGKLRRKKVLKCTMSVHSEGQMKRVRLQCTRHEHSRTGGVGGTGRRERERESQDYIPYINLMNRKRRMVDVKFTKCVHMMRQTNWVPLRCTWPEHLRTRGVGGIGRRKGCVGEREYVLNVCTG